MTGWFDARIASKTSAADGLIHLTLDVPSEVALSHTVAGQYVKLTAGEPGEGFFAIASGPQPKDERFELLLKLGGAVTDAVSLLSVGDAVRVTTAQGKGFPLEKAEGRDLVLVATGSGISPVHSVIQAILKRRSSYGIVSLYFGARTPTSFSYRDDFDAWREASIDVFPVVSKPADTGWTGLTGYVQSHLDGVHLPTALAFLCGQKAMVEAVKKVLTDKGMPPGAIFLNF